MTKRDPDDPRDTPMDTWAAREEERRNEFFALKKQISTARVVFALAAVGCLATGLILALREYSWVPSLLLWVSLIAMVQAAVTGFFAQARLTDLREQSTANAMRGANVNPPPPPGRRPPPPPSPPPPRAVGAARSADRSRPRSVT